MKRIATIIFLLCTLAFGARAQHRLVAEVKKSISEYNVTINKLQNAMNKLKPALTHDETKDQAETWYVAGRTMMQLYDKYVSSRNIGQKVDVKAMSQALLLGHDYFDRSLKLDTVMEMEKNGKPKMDSKTNKPKIKTKFSADIVNRLAEHFNDFNVIAGELYNLKDWDGAYRAWDIYLHLAQGRLASKSILLPDSTMGQTCYYQAITRWQQSDNRQAADLFAQARQLGYTKKEAFDYALVCLSALHDEPGIASTAQEAFAIYGTSDMQYIRILINNDINKKDFDQAIRLLDQAIAVNDEDAELHNLKGLVVEQQSGLEAALPHFKRSVELQEDNAQALFNVGRYYYNRAATLADKVSSRKTFRNEVMPLYREAMPYFEKSMALDPTNDEVVNALRNIYYKLGEGKKLESMDKQGRR